MNNERTDLLIAFCIFKETTFIFSEISDCFLSKITSLLALNKFFSYFFTTDRTHVLKYLFFLSTNLLLF